MIMCGPSLVRCSCIASSCCPDGVSKPQQECRAVAALHFALYHELAACQAVQPCSYTACSLMWQRSRSLLIERLLYLSITHGAMQQVTRNAEAAAADPIPCEPLLDPEDDKFAPYYEVTCRHTIRTVDRACYLAEYCCLSSNNGYSHVGHTKHVICEPSLPLSAFACIPAL